MTFIPLPIKVFGEIVGWSTPPTDEEIAAWERFEADFPFPQLLPTFKTIFMEELDSPARAMFLKVMQS